MAMAGVVQSRSGSDPAVATPTAQVIGNAFVQQYYLILHKSPELVHRFYQDTSKLGRPEPNGEMASVSSLVAINEKILSMDLMKAEIKTVDAQDSLNGGVIVLVTGDITAHDGITREFTQTFFLAPQEKGYFVLNDLFRYAADANSENVGGGCENAQERGVEMEMSNGAVTAQEQAEQEIAPQEHVMQYRDITVVETIEEEVYNPPINNNTEELVAEEEEIPVPEVINEIPVIINNNNNNNNNNVISNNSNNNVGAALPVASSPAVPVSSPLEDAPKKSYASIVKVMKLNTAPISAPVQVARSAAPVQVPSSAPAKQEKQVVPTAAPVKSSTDSPAFSNNASDNNAAPVQELDDGHSIYVRNLPLNATPQQLEDEFAKFGTIRSGGIQVRSHKAQGFCYGFVEFEDAASVQNAIAASPVTLAGRQCYVEEKRAGGSRGGGNSRGGRFSGPRGGGNNERSGSFRNDGLRSGPPRGGPGPRGGYGRDFGGNNSFRGGPPRGAPGPRGPGPRGPPANPIPAPATASNSK